MLKLASSELQKRPGAALDTVQREPIVIESYGRARAVLLSMQEYQRLKRLNREALSDDKGR